jgi:HSP20 family protein
VQYEEELMLVRFDPFKEIDRAFGVGRTPSMAMDAFRHGETFQVDLDLPGVDADSIDLTVERKVLTVRAARRGPQVEGATYVAKERPRGSFSRQLFLGETLDADRIEARYHDGVLTLVIPVAGGARPRRIEVSSDAAPAAIPEAPAADEAPGSDEVLADANA